MRKVVYLISAALVAMMILLPTALAQDTTMMMGGGSTMMMEDTGVSGTGTGSDLPSSGGPQILLPAAALLLGSGILAFAVLRRR